jgi:tetratricopeptide (TPR) repeat protein
MKIATRIFAFIVLAATGSVQAANFCGELKNAFGPFDYRKRAEFAAQFDLVEGAHFTSDVENGIKGNTSTIGGDLDYTLRAIPNHHRALASLARYAVRTKEVKLAHATYPVACYFERAVRMAPDDGDVRAEYGNYLFALGESEKAFEMYKDAVAMAPDNATFNYNLGLAYLKAKNYEQANTYAHKAYALGFPLPGLKNMLTAAGKWDDKPE